MYATVKKVNNLDQFGKLRPLIVRCAGWSRRSGATARGATHCGCWLRIGW